MRVIQVNNRHRIRGGLDIVAEATAALLTQRGVKVFPLTGDSRTLAHGLAGRFRAFAYGLYSPRGCQAMTAMLRRHRPDVVHVHQVYPFFSPWILKACRQAGVPVVMTCHDYRLTCPIAVHQRQGDICQLCAGGREYWCALKNCRDNIFESTAYALRHLVARKFKLFSQVTVFIAISHFVKEWLRQAGFTAAPIEVIPNLVSLPEAARNGGPGDYVAYLGRISPEKGIDTLLVAARRTGLPLRLAGDPGGREELLRSAPANARFVGPLAGQDLVDFYLGARLVVVPSRWFEPFGLVAAEAMSYGLPVLAARIGALPELVEEGVTGLHFTPGDAADLADKMQTLWTQPELCRQMGQAGRDQARREFNPDIYFQRLMAVYARAVELNQLS